MQTILINNKTDVIVCDEWVAIPYIRRSMTHD